MHVVTFESVLIRRCNVVYTHLNCFNSRSMLSLQLPTLGNKMRCYAARSVDKGVTRPCFVPRSSCPGLVRTRRDRAACQHRCRATDPKKDGSAAADAEEDTFEGLTEEEDWVVPGSNLGSLSKNTELGQAVDFACDELDHLGGLENEMLQQADDVLKKFGFKAAVLQPSAGAEEGAGDGPDSSKEQ